MQPQHPRIVEVTALRRHRRQLTLDDERVFVFGDEACERLHVRKGIEATPELLEGLDREDRRAGMHEAALNLLSYRMRSESELRQRLRRRGADDEAIDAELERLRNAGLVDDTRFAEAWVEQRGNGAPRSGRMLRYELRAKGVAAAASIAATAEVDDVAAALDLARTRGRKLAGAEFPAFASKVGGVLQRRGFDFATTQTAVRAAWSELHDGSPEDE